MTDFALARRNMVEGQLRPNRVTNSHLLAVIGALPREKFLPDGLRSVAYSDEDVPLGNGRFLMEPMALLARLVKSVVAIESDAALAAAAERTATELGLTGVEQKVGPLEAGVAASGPYDVILIEGSVRQVPPAILEQLVDGGRMATIVAGPPGALGSAQLFVKEGGVTSGRPLFDAGTPPLPGFAPPPRFTF